MAQKKNPAQTVRDLVEPKITDLGYRIWDVEFGKVGTEWHLEITIDSDNGIDVQDCEKVHRAIEPLIDEADPIEDFYYLDVSSPGLERSIRLSEHYKACIGETIEIKLFAALDGKKSLVGELVSFDPESDNAVIKVKNGTEYTVGRKLISKANVYFEFN